MHFKCPYCSSEHNENILICPNTGYEINWAIKYVGKLVGKYEILRLIGQGGMGAVYEARHIYVRRKVAIKLLNPQLSNSVESIERFMREARTTGEIGHPNIIEIYDIDKDPSTGVYYLVMELLKGRTLQNLILEKKYLSVLEISEIMLKVLSALHASHSFNIVHRDMKPENIFLKFDNEKTIQVKILDFGIAKIKEEMGKLTRTGQILGTPYYMAPELILGQEIDHRIDMYACGVIMYECLTGRLPYDGNNLTAILYSIINNTPSDPKSFRKDVPDEFIRVILKAMSKNPSSRYQSTLEMAKDINKFCLEKRDILKEFSKFSKEVELRNLGVPSIDNKKDLENLHENKSKKLKKVKTFKLTKKNIELTIFLLISIFGIFLLTFLNIFPKKITHEGNKNLNNNISQQKYMKQLKNSPIYNHNKSDEPLAITMKIEAQPLGAYIYIDGNLVGQNFYKAEIPKTDRSKILEVKLDGYKSYIEEIYLKNEPIEKKIILEPLKPIGSKFYEGKKRKKVEKQHLNEEVNENAKGQNKPKPQLEEYPDS